MSFGIVVPNRPHRFGKSRSEQEKNLRKEWGCSTLTNEQLDKMKFMEKKARDRVGAKKSYFDQHDVEQFVGIDKHIKRAKRVKRMAEEQRHKKKWF